MYEAEFSQPLCTAVQVALVDTLSSLGVGPAAVVGRSSGEIAAAYAAGGLRAEKATAIVFSRGVTTRAQAQRGRSDPRRVLTLWFVRLRILPQQESHRPCLGFWRDSDVGAALGPDYEYVIYDGQVFTNRIFPYSLDAARAISDTSDEAALRITQQGRLDTLRWT